jgi:hypothetical protein
MLKKGKDKAGEAFEELVIDSVSFQGMSPVRASAILTNAVARIFLLKGGETIVQSWFQMQANYDLWVAQGKIYTRSW